MPACLHVFMVQSTLGTVLVVCCAFAPASYIIVVEATVAQTKTLRPDQHVSYIAGVLPFMS